MADIQSMAHAIRFLAIDSILAAGEGHQGVPLGMAEIAATLYARHLKADPADPLWPDRDRVILSNGHGSMLLYALLHLSGYEKVSLDALKTFRQLGSVCAGHPEIEQYAGIELTTGLLAKGFALPSVWSSQKPACPRSLKGWSITAPGLLSATDAFRKAWGKRRSRLPGI